MHRREGGGWPDDSGNAPRRHGGGGAAAIQRLMDAPPPTSSLADPRASPHPPQPRSVRGETRPGRGDPPPWSPCPSQQGGVAQKGRPRVPHRDDTPASPGLPPPAAASPPPRRRGGGEQTEQQTNGGPGGRRRSRHRLGHTHSTAPPTPTLPPLRSVAVAPERGSRRRAHARGAGHTRRHGKIRAAGRPPRRRCSLSRRRGCGQRGQVGRAQQWAPAWPHTHTTTRAPHHATGLSSRPRRRAALWHWFPPQCTAGSPTHATGGGGGAGDNVRAGGRPVGARRGLPTKRTAAST